MSSKQNLYTGRSGQMAVMAEFLRRGYNVAVPEVDVGEDVLVLRDADANLSRVQVKAAIAKGKATLTGLFKVPLAQLERQYKPDLRYVFALHHNGLWREFLVIPRKRLRLYHHGQGVGYEADNHLLLRFAFEENDVWCGGISLQQYRGDWSRWPPIQH